MLKHAGKPRTSISSTTAAASWWWRSPTPAHAGPGRDAPPCPGAGRGLLGLRERTALYGGELDAGPPAGRRLAGPGPAPGGPGRRACMARSRGGRFSAAGALQQNDRERDRDAARAW